MKITFIYFDFMKGSQGKYYEGIASLSAVLKSHGYDVNLFHITKKISEPEFIEIFERNFSDSAIAAFSCTTNVFYHAIFFSKGLKKKYPNLLTICGGVHPTLCPEESIREEGLDAICRGEGEFPMIEMCARVESSKSISAIPNLWVKEKGEIFKNKVRPLIENLDLLPMPDRNIFNYDSSMDRGMNRLFFVASRGCSYQCSHCCNHALKEIYPNSSCYVRFKSPDKFIKEICFYLKRYQGIKYLTFADDIFTRNRNWFKKFIHEYETQIGLPYACNSRFELIDTEIVEILKNSGCFELRLGLESGDNYIRNSVLKRRQAQDSILKVGKLCEKIGIKLYLFTMVGIPFENMGRALETIKLSAKFRSAVIQTSIYYPYPETDLYHLCKEKGFLTKKRLDSYFEEETVLNLPQFNKAKIIFAFQQFDRLVNIYRWIYKLPLLFQFILERIVDFLWVSQSFWALWRLHTFFKQFLAHRGK